jgi:hypothetical protein
MEMESERRVAVMALLRSPLATESDLAADLERLGRDIQRVRGAVARFHHDGERHFCDAEHDALQESLDASERQLDHLDNRWRAKHTGGTAEAETRLSSDPSYKLVQLRRDICQARSGLLQTGPNTARHFCD